MDTAALQGWLDERVAAHEFSGAALVRRGDETLFSYAGGLADRGQGVPVTGSTRFAIASVTKMVTAATALRLVERGRLGLHEPVLDLLPAARRTAALTGAWARPGWPTPASTSGHSGHDPGVSATVAHYPAQDTTFVVLCNHDRGSAAVHTRLAAEPGLTDPRD